MTRLTSAEDSTPTEDIIRKEIDRWVDCAGVPQMNLLRLVLLRELIQNLHLEKSKCLANGNKPKAQEIKIWETQIQKLKDSQQLTGELFSLIQKSDSTPKRKRILPENLILALGRNNLDRFDRTWDTAIAAEAVSLGWHFWSMDAWVKISLLGEWNQTLTEKLWPHGLILFVESSQTQCELDESDSWRGTWMLALDPLLQNPNELSFHTKQWPGAIKDPPTPTSWKPIYP